MSATRRLRVHVSRRTERFIHATEREEEGEMRRGGAQAAAVAKRKPRPTLSANRMVPGPRFPLVRFDLRRFERSSPVSGS